ncbi:MAG: hypothetical protein QM766_05305 [Burkholderiaceae bacterium]
METDRQGRTTGSGQPPARHFWMIRIILNDERHHAEVKPAGSADVPVARRLEPL